MNARDFLKQRVKLFQGFTDEQLEQLVSQSRVGSYEANEAVAHAGSEAASFGVVLSGTLSASVPGDGGTRQRLGEQVEAAPRHVDQEIVAVTEMPVRRRRAHARRARRFREREAARPFLRNEIERRLDQRFFQVAVVIAARAAVARPAHVKGFYITRGRPSSAGMALHTGAAARTPPRRSKGKRTRMAPDRAYAARSFSIQRRPT